MAHTPQQYQPPPPQGEPQYQQYQPPPPQGYAQPPPPQQYQPPPPQGNYAQQPPPPQGNYLPPTSVVYVERPAEPQIVYVERPAEPQIVYVEKNPAGTTSHTVTLSRSTNGLTVVCPHCGVEMTTKVEVHSGLFTWLMCAGIACVGCIAGCCLIPFCIDDCKDKVHRCSSCNAVVGQRIMMS